jgi:hypothetical protein
MAQPGNAPKGHIHFGLFSLISLLRTEIFLLLFVARQPDPVDE